MIEANPSPRLRTRPKAEIRVFDWRFVGAIPFVLVLFVFIFIRISGGIMLPMIMRGLQSINLVENP